MSKTSDNKEALGDIKAIETQLINRLCWIPDPETILPHMVFIEDVNEKGEPEYYRCTLEAINSKERTCTLFNHSTGERDSDYNLNSINIDWLDTLWKWYREQKNDTDPELLHLAEKGLLPMFFQHLASNAMQAMPKSLPTTKTTRIRKILLLNSPLMNLQPIATTAFSMT